MSGLYLGIMSGTSLDGIDLALVNINMNVDGELDINTIATQAYEFPPLLRTQLFALCGSQQITLAEIGQLDTYLGEVYADVTNQFIIANGIDKTMIKAIGCHGQTVFHQPNGKQPFSMQLGNAAVLAANTGIQTISNFRAMDIALGGQGAPLVPVFHQALFKRQLIDNEALAILNIGGIANVSLINQSGTASGFDTGPGNVLLDAWIQCKLNKPYDKNGDWAAQGKCDAVLLKRLLNHDFFKQLGPKSTGRELFNLAWLEEALVDFSHVSAVDVQTTLTHFTAKTIINSLEGQLIKKIVVCGGGARNITLLKQMQHQLPTVEIVNSHIFDISADFMEAIAFAWLAYKNCMNETLALRDVTGARRCEIAGQLTKVTTE